MSNDSPPNSLGGLLSNLTRLVEKLDEAAEDGVDVERKVEFGSGEDSLNGVFGLHIRSGVGKPGDGDAREVTVEPFGNVREDDTTGSVVVEEVREPVTDVYDEGDCVRIVAEMPGVTAEDVILDVDGDVCVLKADTDRHRYQKEMHLPQPVAPKPTSIRASNGIVDVELTAQSS
jgi:HSP20 family protein